MKEIVNAYDQDTLYACRKFSKNIKQQHSLKRINDRIQKVFIEKIISIPHLEMGTD